jgi:hypothetical protein
MPTICELIPDPEMLLALDPEELGGVLLQVYADEQGSSNLFSPNQVAMQAFRPIPPRYRDEYRRDVLLAIAKLASGSKWPDLLCKLPTKLQAIKC